MSTIYQSQMDTDKPNFNQKLFCIEYPGRVNNVNKMLQTLGGVETIGTAYGSKNRRVELRFRPDDIYCKPACGDRQATIGLLIKVKVKKKIRDVNMPCSSRDSEKLHSMTFVTSLVGVVDTIYRFENLCDFQYLPMDTVTSQDSSSLQGIYERLLPETLPSTGWLAEDDAPYFLTPPVFSRFDTIHYYGSQKPTQAGSQQLERRIGKPVARKVKEPTGAIPANTIGRTRRRRQGYAIFMNHSDGQVPARPNPEALKMLRIKFLDEQHLSALRDLFAERPVWSKNGLMYRTGFNKDQLKLLLPSVAYYFVTGPWRVMWCRYGYDPREHPDSCVYQTLDYRVRAVGGFKSQVRAKRSYSNYLLPYKSSPSSRPKVVIISRHSIARAYHEARAGAAANRRRRAPDENTCVFRPGYVPPTRQMFYQYCDVLVPEIETMLRRLPTEPRLCHPTLGFLPVGFDSRCREIVNSLVSAELRKRVQPSTGTRQRRRAEQQQQQQPENDAHEIVDSDAEEPK